MDRYSWTEEDFARVLLSLQNHTKVTFTNNAAGSIPASTRKLEYESDDDTIIVDADDPEQETKKQKLVEAPGQDSSSPALSSTLASKTSTNPSFPRLILTWKSQGIGRSRPSSKTSTKDKLAKRRFPKLRLKWRNHAVARSLATPDNASKSSKALSVAALKSTKESRAAERSMSRFLRKFSNMSYQDDSDQEMSDGKSVPSSTDKASRDKNHGFKPMNLDSEPMRCSSCDGEEIGDGQTWIQCDICLAWQHANCVYYADCPEDMLPDEHFCEMCCPHHYK